MSKTKIGWIALLVLIYGSFWIWYGGNGTPLTVAEGHKMLDQITAMHAKRGSTPAPSDFRANMEKMIPIDDGREFYAVNLETAKKGPEAEKSAEAYGKIVMPLLFKRGSFPIFVGQRYGLMLGQLGNGFDQVAVVRYRSLRDMLDMNIDPEMAKGVPHKFAALEHTEVFIVRPVISVEMVRLTLALLLLVIGFLGTKLIGRLQARSKK